MQVNVINESTQEFNGKNYWLYPNSKYYERYKKRLHRAVWEYHNGPIPKGYHVHHKDNDRANNQIENLESYQSELLLTKAALHSQIRDSKNAIKLYKQALQVCEEFEKDEIFVDLAVEYENAHDFNGAIQILQQGLLHNPKNEFAFSGCLRSGK